MLVRVTIAIALLLLPTTLQAQVEKRIALLIGNKDYKAGVGALTNPLNDIRVLQNLLAQHDGDSRSIPTRTNGMLIEHDANGSDHATTAAAG
jgi:hypothetical protein